MNRRKSTVHDLAALRLHPDGSRVPSASLNTKSKPKGRIAVDRKNNWIAYDAGGSASVKTKRRKKTKAEDGKSASKAQKKAPNIPAELSPDESDHQSAWSPSDDDISGDEAQGNMNTKSKKRKRFNHTFDFLSNPKLSNGKNMEFPPIYADDFRSVPLPSSDLLKSIHHHASAFYANKGSLFDAPAEARRERIIRSLHKDSAGAKGDGSDIESSINPEAELRSEEGARGQPHDRMEGRRESGFKNSTRRDMYRAFDGSALMAIALLVQEHAISISKRPSHENPQRTQPLNRDADEVNEALRIPVNVGPM